MVSAKRMRGSVSGLQRFAKPSSWDNCDRGFESRSLRHFSSFVFLLTHSLTLVDGFSLRVIPGVSYHLTIEADAVAQPWPELPAQMKRFLDLTFLVVHRDEAGKQQKPIS